jgi:hypothetical protein
VDAARRHPARVAVPNDPAPGKKRPGETAPTFLIIATFQCQYIWAATRSLRCRTALRSQKWPPSQERFSSAACAIRPHRKGLWLSGDVYTCGQVDRASFGRTMCRAIDHGGDRRGLCTEHDTAACHLGRVGTDAPGRAAKKLGRNRPVLGRHDIPARLDLPRHLADLCLQRLHRDRNLGVSKKCAVAFAGVAGKPGISNVRIPRDPTGRCPDRPRHGHPSDTRLRDCTHASPVSNPGQDHEKSQIAQGGMGVGSLTLAFGMPAWSVVVPSLVFVLCACGSLCGNPSGEDWFSLHLLFRKQECNHRPDSPAVGAVFRRTSPVPCAHAKTYGLFAEFYDL